MNISMPAKRAACGEFRGASKQHGLGLSGFLFGAVALILASIIGLKLIPAYMQNEQIKNAFVVIANDPEMQKAIPRDIRMAFSKRAEIDDISVIKAEDVEIASDGGRLVLSASYTVVIPMVGNVSLSLDFYPSSAE